MKIPDRIQVNIWKNDFQIILESNSNVPDQLYTWASA